MNDDNNIGIHKATLDELEELAPIIEQAAGKDLDVLYKWATHRSDRHVAADPSFVIARMNDKLIARMNYKLLK